MPRLTGYPPVPIRGPRALPLIGAHLAALRFLADPIGRLGAMHRAHGDIVALVDRSPAFVFAHRPEHNREVLANPALFQHLTEIPIRVPPGSALSRLNKALILMNGEQHRRHRRLMMPAFQKAALDAYAGDIVAVTEGALERWPIGSTADVAALLRELTLRVAVRCIFGLDAGEGAEALGRVALEQLEVLASPLAVAIPLDAPGTPYRRALEVSARYEASLRGLIERKRRLPSGRDALSAMIRAHDEDGSSLTDEELIGEANTLFIAGHDTSASTLAGAVLLLAQHPEVLAGVLDEIDGALRGGPPSVTDLPRLALTDRIIQETMRLLPATPILFARTASSEARLGPYTLPEGAHVVLSPLLTHRDPDRFPEPLRFRPARWEALQPGPYEYLPFGAGPRMCLGAGFAAMALRLMLPMILRRYRLTLAHRAHVEVVVRGINLGFRRGLPMLIAPQDRRASRREGVRGNLDALVDLS